MIYQSCTADFVRTISGCLKLIFRTRFERIRPTKTEPSLIIVITDAHRSPRGTTSVLLMHSALQKYRQDVNVEGRFDFECDG